MIYGAYGTIRLEAIRAALTGAMTSNPYLMLGLGMMLIGFGFKVAAVPFHMWTPDAYEGAPTPVTGFMAVGVKLAAFAGFLRVFMVHLGPINPQWTAVLWVIAVLTMTAGNLIALVQTDIDGCRLFGNRSCGLHHCRHGGIAGAFRRGSNSLLPVGVRVH